MLVLLCCVMCTMCVASVGCAESLHRPHGHYHPAQHRAQGHHRGHSTDVMWTEALALTPSFVPSFLLSYYHSIFDFYAGNICDSIQEEYIVH